MFKRTLLAVVALALAAACSDSPTSVPLTAPDKPLFDDIRNQLDLTVDPTAEVMPLVYPGANGTTQLGVVPRNGDGKNGCNFQGPTTSLVVSVASGNTAVATVSPSSITFSSCGDVPTLTVTPVGRGSATISLSQSSNNTGGTFLLTTATFTVNVTAPPNTPPTLSITGVTVGASYSKGSVPAATCSVTDAEDGNSSFPATLSAITGTYASDGIGQQEASCSYTDGGGLTASASVTYNIVDPSPPTIGYVLAPPSPDGSNDWYKSNVALTWTVSEPQSPNSLVKSGCVDQNITADQAATTYSCSATSAGGSAGPVSVTIKRDATPPTISGSRSPGPNGHGWNNGDVTVSFSCSDATSGVASCGPDQTLNSEGAGQSATGAAVDNAGNSASATVSGINIDKTAPIVSLVGGPADGGSYYFGDTPAAPTCSASDALSGLDGSCSVGGYSAAVGTHTVTATATDKASNQSSVSATYTVLPWTLSGFYQPVDMRTPANPDAYNTVKAGSTVPLKFEVFKEPTRLTEFTDVSIVKPLFALKVLCTAGSEDPVEEFATTGNTILRYDTVAGQFIQNWQTPKVPGTCYKVTLTTLDGSTLNAYFKLK
jgi:hypothetical protein